MKKQNKKQYNNARNKIFDKNYNKTTAQMVKNIATIYKDTLDEIDKELLKWESKRNSGKMPNTFAYSEEQNLRESKKAIELLLKEIGEKENEILSKGLDDLYLADILDMRKLETKYLEFQDNLELQYVADYMRRNDNREISEIFDIVEEIARTTANNDAIANRMENIRYIEQMFKNPEIAEQTAWYVAYNGTPYQQRIAKRIVKLQGEVNSIISSMYALGKGYDYAIKKIKERLDVSYSYAKTLVQTECRVAEVQANREHYATMGVKYYGRHTVRDSHVCPICKEHENDVYTDEEVKKNPWVFILHPHERCYIEPLSQQRGKERYANRSNK